MISDYMTTHITHRSLQATTNREENPTQELRRELRLQAQHLAHHEDQIELPRVLSLNLLRVLRLCYMFCMVWFKVLNPTANFKMAQDKGV